MGSIRLKSARSPHIFVNFALKLGESPFLGDENLLTSGKLEFGPSEGFNNGSLMPVISSDGHQRLSNTYASHSSLGLAKGTSHSGLETISACARQHFVDPQNVIRMDANPNVELILSCVFHDVLVTTNTSGLKGFSGKLFKFIRHEMNTQREFMTPAFLRPKSKILILGSGTPRQNR